MRWGLWNFVRDQWSTNAPVVKVDLTGKTVLVLGANTGLGLEATKHFASMNPGRLLLACRSASRGQDAVDKVKAATGYTKAEVWIVDLADFASVTQFGDSSSATAAVWISFLLTPPLGSLIIKLQRMAGKHRSLQVNSISTSLFCLRLLPAMLKTAQEHSTLPRMVIVSSGSHYEVKALDKRLVESPEMLKTLGSAEYSRANMSMRYPVTKLCSVFFARALNAHIPPATPLIVNTVDPGFCHSDLTRNITGLRAFIINIMAFLLARTAEQGSRRLVWSAVGQQEQPDTLRGEFITMCKVQEVSDYVLSVDGQKAQNRFWDETVNTLSAVDPKVKNIVEKYLAV
ncbi:hypothetical protein B0H16DRAFT_1796663 [Mycena metata]|uniref:NAD(P)-binding protein n=1 Tax=Mycena metata TaxID=1033252 RepID=A0AAD7NL35_9AGAR|nr:hypothetical protein B0H16DRAFT_1796663 [Mycena metata]